MPYFASMMTEEYKASLRQLISATVEESVRASIAAYDAKLAAEQPTMWESTASLSHESAEETASGRTMWFSEKARRRIERVEDMARRDPVWAEKLARRHAAFRDAQLEPDLSAPAMETSTSTTPPSVLTACVVREGNLATRPPTTCSTNFPSRAATAAVSTITPAAASIPSAVTVAITPERCSLDLEPATAISTPTSALGVSGARAEAVSYLAHIHLPASCIQSKDKPACALSADIVLSPGAPMPATTTPVASAELEPDPFIALSAISSAGYLDNTADRELLACSLVEQPPKFVAARSVDDYSLVTNASAVVSNLVLLVIMCNEAVLWPFFQSAASNLIQFLPWDPGQPWYGKGTKLSALEHELVVLKPWPSWGLFPCSSEVTKNLGGTFHVTSSVLILKGIYSRSIHCFEFATEASIHHQLGCSLMVDTILKWMVASTFENCQGILVPLRTPREGLIWLHYLGIFSQLQRNFPPRHLDASEYLSHAADSIRCNCAPGTAGMVVPYGSIFLWELAWSSFAAVKWQRSSPPSQVWIQHKRQVHTPRPWPSLECNLHSYAKFLGGMGAVQEQLQGHGIAGVILQLGRCIIGMPTDEILQRKVLELHPIASETTTNILGTPCCMFVHRQKVQTGHTVLITNSPAANLQNIQFIGQRRHYSSCIILMPEDAIYYGPDGIQWEIAWFNCLLAPLLFKIDCSFKAWLGCHTTGTCGINKHMGLTVGYDTSYGADSLEVMPNVSVHDCKLIHGFHHEKLWDPGGLCSGPWNCQWRMVLVSCNCRVGAQRGITIKSTGISLFYVMIDESLASNKGEKIGLVPTVNKMDRCFLELQVESEEAYQTFSCVIENTHVIMVTYEDVLLGDVRVYLKKGIVAFSAILHCWARTTYERCYVLICYEAIKQIIEVCMNDQNDNLWPMLKKLGITMKIDDLLLVSLVLLRDELQLSWDPGGHCYAYHFYKFRINQYYYISVFLEHVYVICYLNFMKDGSTRHDFGVMKRQVPGDPGDSTRHRLEVKPEFKKGGMLATLLLADGPTLLGRGLRRRQTRRLPIYTRKIATGELGLERNGFGLLCFCLLLPLQFISPL